jgi:hypothetical protein
LDRFRLAELRIRILLNLSQQNPWEEILFNSILTLQKNVLHLIKRILLKKRNGAIRGGYLSLLFNEELKR